MELDVYRGLLELFRSKSVLQEPLNFVSRTQHQVIPIKPYLPPIPPTNPSQVPFQLHFPLQPCAFAVCLSLLSRIEQFFTRVAPEAGGCQSKIPRVVPVLFRTAHQHRIIENVFKWLWPFATLNEDHWAFNLLLDYASSSLHTSSRASFRNVRMEKAAVSEPGHGETPKASCN